MIKVRNYKDEYGNKVKLYIDEDGDFGLTINYADGTYENTLISKQDFKKMNELNEQFVKNVKTGEVA
jgi:hypothetical protein